MENSKLISGFDSFKDISGYAHALSDLLKENGECNLGGAKLLDRMIKADGAFKNRHAFRGAFGHDSASHGPGASLTIMPNTTDSENEVVIGGGDLALCNSDSMSECGLQKIHRLTAYFGHDSKGKIRTVVPGLYAGAGTRLPEGGECKCSRHSLREKLRDEEEINSNRARALSNASFEMLRQADASDMLLKANANPDLVSELLGEPEGEESRMSLQDAILEQHKWQSLTQEILTTRNRLKTEKSLDEAQDKGVLEEPDTIKDEGLNDATSIAKSKVLARASCAFARERNAGLDDMHDYLMHNYSWPHKNYDLNLLDHLSCGCLSHDDSKGCPGQHKDQLVYDLIRKEITPFLSKGMQNWISTQYQNELSEALVNGELPKRPAPRYWIGKIKDKFNFKSFEFSSPMTQKYASILPKDHVCQCIKVDWPLKEISSAYFAELHKRSIVEMLKSDIVSGLITYYEDMCEKHNKFIPAEDFERAIPGFVYHKIGSTLRNQ